MQCWKVLTNVQFDEGRKSCFVIESGEYFNFLDAVTDEIGQYKVSASTMRDFIDWVQGKRGPYVLLVSLDLQFATLRETFSGGEFKLEPGEELLPFWRWPIQGGVEKYAAVLDREIGLLPEVCKKFGYTPTSEWPKIRRRLDLRGFAEFDPIFYAELRGDVPDAKTLNLLWHYLLGENEDNDSGETFSEIKKELTFRLKPWNDQGHLDFMDGALFDTDRMTMREVEARRKRAEAYAEFIDLLWNDFSDIGDEDLLVKKLREAMLDLDLAVEVYVVLFWGNRLYSGNNKLKGLLWSIIAELTLIEPPEPRRNIIY